jgi:predicted NAD/FAD-dependent oxidoreductase
VTEVWPIQIGEPLPTVAVPLLKGDADVPLDLQAALTTVYDAGGFDLVIDYREPPDVELSVEESAWLDELLRAKRLRN